MTLRRLIINWSSLVSSSVLSLGSFLSKNLWWKSIAQDVIFHALEILQIKWMYPTKCVNWAPHVPQISVKVTRRSQNGQQNGLGGFLEPQGPRWVQEACRRAKGVPKWRKRDRRSVRNEKIHFVNGEWRIIQEFWSESYVWNKQSKETHRKIEGGGCQEACKKTKLTKVEKHFCQWFMVWLRGAQKS